MPTLHLVPGSVPNREFRETVATDAPSSDVLIPYGARPTVRLIAFAAPGRSVQYTTSPEAMIWAGTAIWAEWGGGVITGSAEGRAKGGMTGVRLSPLGGGGIWEIIA